MIERNFIYYKLVNHQTIHLDSAGAAAFFGADFFPPFFGADFLTAFFDTFGFETFLATAFFTFGAATILNIFLDFIHLFLLRSYKILIPLSFLEKKYQIIY